MIGVLLEGFFNGCYTRPEGVRGGFRVVWLTGALSDTGICQELHCPKDETFNTPEMENLIYTHGFWASSPPKVPIPQ